MAFIQPCFIRKNSPELRKRLEELGYKDYGNLRFHGDPIIIYCETNHFFTSPFALEGAHYRGKYDNFIDCGDNEELFLAIAALRDDTNENQWFIAQDTMWDENYNGEITVYYEENEWLMWGYYSLMEEIPSDFRKATAEEIIDHFSNQ